MVVAASDVMHDAKNTGGARKHEEMENKINEK
jgi:hypothetical protein